MEPYQFSCWNGKSYEKYYREVIKLVSANKIEKRAWDECLAIAGEMVTGDFAPTTEAKFYHTNAVHPRWSHNMVLVSVIGDHRIYKLG